MLLVFFTTKIFGSNFNHYFLKFQFDEVLSQLGTVMWTKSMINIIYYLEKIVQTFFVSQVAELISLSQTLTNERDDAIQSRENAENELLQLQLVIDKLTEESGQRTREEIDKIEKKANENIENLLSELHHMEKVNCK